MIMIITEKRKKDNGRKKERKEVQFGHENKLHKGGGSVALTSLQTPVITPLPLHPSRGGTQRRGREGVTDISILRLRLHLHLFLNRGDRWGTTDDFTTSFLHFSLFSTALWNLSNSRPVHSLMLPSHPFSSVHLVFFSLSLCLARWFWLDLMSGRHVLTTSVCVFSLRLPHAKKN